MVDNTNKSEDSNEDTDISNRHVPEVTTTIDDTDYLNIVEKAAVCIKNFELRLVFINYFHNIKNRNSKMI
jgi:hypothetical protein